MPSTDVIIIGAGPAGLAAAAVAAEAGVRVVVLERQNEIGSPVHTSGGSWVADLQEFGIPPQYYHPVSKVIFLSPQREVQFRYANPPVAVLDVRGMYQYLARRAVDAGATLLLHHTVLGPLLDGEQVTGVRVNDSKGQPVTYTAPLTIDASGFPSVISKAVGIHKGFRRYGFGAEYDLYAPNFDQDTLYLIMGSHAAPQGYAWAFPWGKERVRLGSGIMRPDADADARDYLQNLATRVPQLQGPLSGSSPIEYHTGLFPCEPLPRHLVVPGLIAAGDAAMQGSTLVGEGIRYAIRAGRLAGEVAAAGIHKHDYSASFLRSYERRWQAAYGHQLAISYLINQHITRYSDAKWDSSLDLLARLDPDIMAQTLHGDFTPRLAMKIIRRHPHLLKTAGSKILQKWLRKPTTPVPSHYF